MTEQAPAGWYPVEAGRERYWDGQAWTAHVRDVAAIAPGPAPDDPNAGGWGSAIKRAMANRYAAKEEEARRHAELVQAAGAMVTNGTFGMSAIEVYIGGYVRVAEADPQSVQPAKITKSTPYEKLHSIKFTAATEKQESSTFDSSSLMKGASTLIQGGSGLLKASVPGLAVAGLSQVARAKLGKTFLTIATDRAIHC